MAGDTTMNGSIAAPFGPPRNISELNKDELLALISVLTQENIQLKCGMTNLSGEISRLQAENRKLVVLNESVESLRGEVERLKAENENLRKQNERQTADIADLKSTVNAQSVQVAHLMKAHAKESKLAIQKLFDDAERVTDKSIFSADARVFISKHSSKLRDEGDFTRKRIKEAISHFDGSKLKIILIDLFTKSYSIPFEEEEDDSWLSELDG
jgi:TolA-binding protein